MKDLKNLTEQQAIEIATISNPEVQWKVIKSKTPWNGFDLIEIDSTAENSIYVFQIDCRDETELNQKPRFRFYENLFEYKCNNYQDILDYLKTL